ncbi:MAG TPA: DUF4397 domain-containing protein [Steroidobacteraceae bacterium]|nr:DUF4397 domain-containing protein [Steroidobacteraceae bacterium]
MGKTLRLMTALVPLLLVGCYSDDERPYYGPIAGPPAGPQAHLQILHASADAPPFAVLLDGVIDIPYLDYGQGTGEQYVSASTTHTLAVQALTPGAPTTVIGPTTLSLLANMDYVVVAEGLEAHVAPVIFSHALAIVPASVTQVQFLQAAPGTSSVDVYLTAPGASLSASTPFGAAVAFQGSAGPTQVPSGQYEIRVTAAGNPGQVYLDSGTVTLLGGDDLVIAAVQNTGPGSAPITLSVTDAYGDTGQIVDRNTPASLRVIHDVPDAQPINVLATDQSTSAATMVGPTLSYGTFTPYQPLAPDAYGIAFTLASNASDILVSRNLRLDGGSVHSVYAIGKLAAINTLVTRDDDRRYATQARLRILHGSPSAGPLDVYLTAPGAGIASANPTYAGLPFGTDTGFVSYVAASYDLTVTAAGSKTPLIGPTPVTLNNAGLYTAVARDPQSGGTQPGLILLDDL